MIPRFRQGQDEKMKSEIERSVVAVASKLLRNEVSRDGGFVEMFNANDWIRICDGNPRIAYLVAHSCGFVRRGDIWALQRRRRSGPRVIDIERLAPAIATAFRELDPASLISEFEAA